MSNYVDISSHNGTPDLQAYWDAGHRDLMLKATEGTGYYWPQMPSIARQWHAMGGRCGYYHWLYGTLSAQSQHDWFWSHVTPVFQPGDWLMTDFEDVDNSRWVSDAQHLAIVKEFDRLCDQHALTHDYAPNWYIANMPLCTDYFKGRQHIVPSDYSHDPPLNPHGLSYIAHQFTDRATVAGFSGPVDYNRWLAPPAPLPLTIPPVPRGEPMILLRINEPSVPKGKPWPGVFLQGSDLSLHHIVDSLSLAGYRKAGLQQAVISYAEYDAYRTQGMIHAAVKA